MSEAPRDNNSIPAALAYDGTNTQPLKVDPVTGRLLVTIVAEGGNTNTARPVIRDNNSIPVSAVITDDANDDVRPLIVDPNNSALMVERQ